MVGKIPEISKEYTATVFRVKCGVLRVRANVKPHEHSTECGLDKERLFIMVYSEQYTDRRTDGPAGSLITIC